MSKHRPTPQGFTPFTPSPAYRIFLNRLINTRQDKGLSQEQLAHKLELTPEQVTAFESGEAPLGFIDVRNWLLALGMPFTHLTQTLDDELRAKLDAEIEATEAPELNKYTRAEPLPHQVPTIQVLFFPIGQAPEVRTIPNHLKSMQELVGGLITTFETGIDGTIGVANDEALLESMPLNRSVSATGAHIFGPFFVAGDAPHKFRSLAPREMERVLDALAPELPQTEFPRIIAQLEGGQEWMDLWN